MPPATATPSSNYWYSRALAPRYSSAGPTPPPATSALQDFVNGGSDPDAGERGAHRSGLRDAPLSELPGAVMTGLSVLGGGIPALATVGSHAVTGKSLTDNIADFLGWGGNSLAGVPGLGIENGVQTQVSPELQGRSDPSQGQGPAPSGEDASSDRGVDPTGGGSANPDGGYAKGGKVARKRMFGPNPPGPDDGAIYADEGEEVVTAKRAKELGPKALAELRKKKLDRGALVRALRS